MLFVVFYNQYIHGKNGFAEVSKNLGLKIILLDCQNNVFM